MDKKERIREIMENIDEIMIELLIPARIQKKVNEEAFDKLVQSLEEMKVLFTDCPEVPKKLVYSLLFISTQMNVEAMYCDDEHPVAEKAREIERLLLETFK